MKKAEIIDAAFRVWGRNFYHNTSLSHVARELKVCKPALYRHFISKHALLEAMAMRFFDDYTAFIHEDFEKALKIEDKNEGVFMVIRSATEFYARNVHLFIFALAELQAPKLAGLNLHEELHKRGIDFLFFFNSISGYYIFDPLVMRLAFATLTFFIAGFHNCHKKEWFLIKPQPEKAIANIIDTISTIVGSGLDYTAKEIQVLDYQELENRIKGTVNSIEDDPLLRAVAAAVAEAGPWEASMEQVARRSGLAKSSLYCHFKSKNDMMYQLFMTESLRIIDFSRQGMKQSAIPLEQLYLGIFSIAEYLRSKPDILVCLDWVRNQRLDFSPSDDQNESKIDFLQLFEGIGIKPLQIETDNPCVSPWILFLIVKTLMTRNSEPLFAGGQTLPVKEQTSSAKGQALSNVPDSDIRTLYRFITLGIGGFVTSEK